MGCVSVKLDFETHQINHSCRSDPNITGGLPGHHINESIHCVLTREMRPNEKCFSLNHGATRGVTFVIPMQAFSWMLIGLQEDKSFFFFLVIFLHFQMCWLSLPELFSNWFCHKIDELGVKLPASQTSRVPSFARSLTSSAVQSTDLYHTCSSCMCWLDKSTVNALRAICT